MKKCLLLDVIKIPSGAFVAMRTDWSKRWPDAAKMENMDALGVAHYPGWSLAGPEVPLRAAQNNSIRARNDGYGIQAWPHNKGGLFSGEIHFEYGPLSN